jgi:LysM repeat protein
MKGFRLLVPVLVIVALLLILVAPLTASAAPLQTASGSGCSQWYRVHCGDTLSGIAARNSTTVHKLMTLNGISNPNRIFAGQVLCVRGQSGRDHREGLWYTVHCGDTLAAIGRRYGWSAWYLASANGLANPNRIYAGQRLWIPAHS